MSTFTAIPLHLSPTPDDTDISAAHIGAEMLGLPLMPQGEVIARVLEARIIDEDGDEVRLYKHAAIQVPRRSTKTTSVWATILGRCMTMPGHKAVVTAQDRTRAAEAMREVMRALDLRYRDDPASPLRLRWSQGGEAIEFENGSRIWVVKPKPEAFRGSAADTIYFDEAGELDPDESANLVAGALPLMDTRLLGQVIISGTPGPNRAGMFWDALEAGRNAVEGRGVVDYAARDTDDPADESVWRRVHPGLACGLTKIKVIRGAFETMALPQFMAEYLGVWATDPSTRAIPPDAWEATAATWTDRPKFVTFAFEVSQHGQGASIAAAWRDEHGTAHIELIDQRPGTDWLVRRIVDLTTKYRAKCAHDDVTSNLEVAQRLGRLPATRSRIVATATKETSAGQSRLEREILKGTLVHQESNEGLNIAADKAIWRGAVHDRATRFFGTRDHSDISPLIAAAQALWLYDQQKEKQPLKTYVATG